MWCPAMTVESPLCQFPVSATYTVMAGLVPAIHVFFAASCEDVDAGPAPGMTDEARPVGLGITCQTLVSSIAYIIKSC